MATVTGTTGNDSVVGGSGNDVFAVGAERLFALDNGSSSAVFQFTAAHADAVVTVDELF
jgi:Ca2+-binding RTX toxin-like protein